MIIEKQLDTVTKVVWDSATGMMKIIPFAGPEIWLALEAQVKLVELLQEIVEGELNVPNVKWDKRKGWVQKT